MFHRLLVPAALVGLSALGSAQDVGSYVDSVELENFGQTEAKSFDDYLGRAVLIEFFAYW